MKILTIINLCSYFFILVVLFVKWKTNKNLHKKIKYLENKNVILQKKITNAILIGENLKALGDFRPITKRALKQSQLIRNYLNNL